MKNYETQGRKNCLFNIKAIKPYTVKLRSNTFKIILNFHVTILLHRMAGSTALKN